jgi:5-methyltetrahydrofolate--homocysteine methyltransferase
MINVAQLLEKANANIPLMIGGATTSELHTAIKIAPSYSAPTIWMKDASQNVIVASQLLNQSTKETFEESHRKKQEELAKAGMCSGENNLSIKNARKKSPNLF